MRSYKRYKGARHLFPLLSLLSLSLALLSLSRAAFSLPLTHACPFLPGTYACSLASSRAVFVLSFVLPCSLVPFLNAYHIGRSTGLVPLSVSYLAIYQVGRLLESGPSTFTSLLLLSSYITSLFFPFPFSSGHFLSCEANWYPNGSGVFLSLFVSSVYPPLQDPRPEFGVSLSVVSFFGILVFSRCPFSFAHGIQQIRVSCPLTTRAGLFATNI